MKRRSDSSDPAPGSDAASRCQGGCLHAPIIDTFTILKKALYVAKGISGNLLKELKLLTAKTVLFSIFLLKTSINFRLLLLITRKVKSLHPLAK